MKSCCIVGAGDFFPQRFRPGEGTLIIAADAGYAHLRRLGVAPDLVIGDFDSLGRPPEHPNVEVCPVRKDYTDMLIAVRRALESGCERLLLHGGTGGRPDHTLANIQTLTYAARRGAQAYLVGGDYTMTALHNGALRFSGYSGGISVFCAGERAFGVYERGLRYGLDDAILTCDDPMGVSNAFDADSAEISVRDGTLLICWLGNDGLPLPEKLQ